MCLFGRSPTRTEAALEETAPAEPVEANARSIATGIHHLTDEAAPSDDSDWSSNGSSYRPHSSPLPLLFSEAGPSSPSLSPLPSRWLHRRLLTTMEIDRHWKISLCWTAPKDNPKWHQTVCEGSSNMPQIRITLEDAATLRQVKPLIWMVSQCQPQEPKAVG